MKKLAAMNDPRGAIFKLLDGTVTFTGKTTVEGTDDGDISIVIPVGISMLTPNLGGKLTSTATEEITRIFGVSTTISESDSKSMCKYLEMKHGNIAVGTFISNRMLAAFNDSINVPVNEKHGALGPSLTDKTLMIKANFSVQRVLDAGVKADVLFSSTNSSAPTLKPAIAFINDAKGEYAFILKRVLPIVSKAPTLKRTIRNSSTKRSLHRDQRGFCRALLHWNRPGL